MHQGNRRHQYGQVIGQSPVEKPAIPERDAHSADQPAIEHEPARQILAHQQAEIIDHVRQIRQQIRQHRQQIQQLRTYHAPDDREYEQVHRILTINAQRPAHRQNQPQRGEKTNDAQ